MSISRALWGEGRNSAQRKEGDKETREGEKGKKERNREAERKKRKKKEREEGMEEGRKEIKEERRKKEGTEEERKIIFIKHEKRGKFYQTMICLGSGRYMPSTICFLAFKHHPCREKK